MACSALMLASASVSFAAKKEENKQTLAEWAAEQTATLPEYVEGVKMYRPEVANESLIISDLVDIKKEKGKQVFLKALMYARERLDDETERIEAVDFKNNRFTIRGTKAVARKDKPETYSYVEAFQGSDGILSFSCGDINVHFKEKGLLPRTLKFEKLNPQSNARDREFIEDLSYAFSDRIGDLVKYIYEHPDIVINHENEIIQGKVVLGMNPDEVRLTLGQPFSEKKTGDRIKWLYENGNSVIFTDGKVTHVMM